MDKNILTLTNAKAIPNIKYDEGNVVDSSVDSEVATIEDALFALRMTEDLLIWLYQTGNMDR